MYNNMRNHTPIYRYLQPSSSRRTLFSFFLFFFLVIVSLPAAPSHAASPLGTLENPYVKKELHEIISDDFRQAVRAAKRPKIDTRLEIINKLMQVKSGSLQPDDFFKQVSELDMPGGKEVRHVLMEVKKDIGNYLGKNGLRMVLGDLYPAGGSKVEKTLLVHRRNIVMDGIDATIKQFAGTKPGFSVYYSEVGGWPDETPEQMKFAGDIDFNFLCGDLETVMKLKEAFDAYIVQRYGRTPEELDIPCTVHGLATGEVYVGLHGQSFAEKVTKTVKKINFGEDGKPVGVDHDTEIPFEEARKTMILESEFSKTPLPDLKELKWPKQPGISLEMIRHFEHDIVKQNVYTDLESFVKAAKYADRSFDAIEEDAGEAGIKDKKLRDFAKGMVENKKSPAKQVELIKNYYDSINKPLPLEIEFAIKRDGKSAATIQANEKVIKAFWDVCRKTMWESANMKIRSLVDDFSKRVKALSPDDAAGAKAIYDEISQYNRMLEVEDRILNDSKAGIHGKLDKTYKSLLGEFRDMVKEFKQKIAHNDQLRLIDPVKQDTFKFVDEMIKLKNDFSLRMAAAAMAKAPGHLNDMLDFMDDGMLNSLRYGPTQDYVALLRKGQGLYWGEQAAQFLKGSGVGTVANNIMSAADIDGTYTEKLNAWHLKVNARLQTTSDWMTGQLEKSCAARGIKLIRGVGGAVVGEIQSLNTTFNEAASANVPAQALMQGMMIYNLSQEIPAYIAYMEKEDWEGLATEFFRRRVPFGSVTERYIMGDYYGVAWETTATLLPPAAIFSAARSIGESLGQKTWDSYWSEELNIFIDNLYTNAEFKIAGVETTGDNIKISQWELLTVTYRGEEFVFDELITMETADAREMATCLQKPSEQRPECFPMEKFRNGLFKWMKSDNAFRTSLRKSDPWIQLIEEMEKQKHVGKKLKDHFQYQKFTRWEQLKVDFLQRVKKKLEDRRAGEQSLLSGNLPKMYDELLQIAGKLDIRPQVEESLTEQVGSDFMMFLESLKDYLRGIYREIQGEVDVWDVYEEYAAVVTEYLRTYKQIWDGRKTAEQNLPVSRQDQGLRILTGPYFLTGISTEDDASSQKWFTYPVLVNHEMKAQLRDIKAEAKADPVQLDLNEDAYDKTILDQLTFHDSFREMWKQVNSRVLDAKISSYLGSELATQTSPNPEGGQSDQERAMERFKYHAKRVKELLNEFRQHYGLEEKDELSELRNLRDRAVSLTAEICADCSSVAASFDEITAAAESAADVFGEFESSINEAVKVVKDLESLEKSLVADHQTAEGLAVQIGDENVLAGERRQGVCQAADAMNFCKSNSERDRLYGEASSANADIKPAFNRARGDYKDLEGIGNKAKEALYKLTQAQKTAQGIQNIPESITSSYNDVRTKLEAAESKLHAGADEKLLQIKEIDSQADELYPKLKIKLKPIKKTPEGKELWSEMKGLMKEIGAQYKVAKGCLKKPKQQFASIKTKADTFLNRYTTLETNLNKIHKSLLPDSQGNQNPMFASALEKANLIDLLASMGKGYVESCTEHLVMAKVCMNNADKLKLVDFSAYMPDIVGMTCKDGGGTVAANNIDFQIVSSGRANHPDLEYRVDSTDPPAGYEVSLQETTALIACFEELDIPAYLATIDCSHLPGSTAVYNQGQRRGICDCVNGMVFNQARSRCINCDQYYQGYTNAFNAGDLKNAQSWINESYNCPWAATAQGQLNAELQRKNCFRIATLMQVACRDGNAGAISGLMAEARNWKCNIDPNLWQLGNNIIAAHNQQVKNQQRQRDQQNMQNMMNMMNMMNNVLGTIKNNRNQPTSRPPTRPPSTSSSGSRGSTSGGSSSSSSGSRSGGATDDCPSGVYLLGVCAE